MVIFSQVKVAIALIRLCHQYRPQHLIIIIIVVIFTSIIIIFIVIVIVIIISIFNTEEGLTYLLHPQPHQL